MATSVARSLELREPVGSERVRPPSAEAGGAWDVTAVRGVVGRWIEVERWPSRKKQKETQGIIDFFVS